jgi:hypothetical protein
MKVYSIGREGGCDIVLNDPSDVISRRHAVLNVSPSGKMTIVDQSTNGTYVNGMRISSGVPYPVTRKDSISFAHVARLNWDLIPSSNQYLKYVVIGVVALLLISGIAFGSYHYFHNSNSGNNEQPALAIDSVKTEKSEKEIRKEVEDSLQRVKKKQDSLENVRKDSLEKVRKDSIARAEKAKGSKEKDNKKPEAPKKVDEKKATRLR